MRDSKTRSGLNAITDPAVYKRVAEVQDKAAFRRDKCGSDTDFVQLLDKLLQEDRQGVIEPELDADRSMAAVHEDLSGRTLSHYQIVRNLGAGGMGVVYRAKETRLQRTVALKFLPALLRDDSASRERFIRGAHVIASIDHQNVCPVYENRGSRWLHLHRDGLSRGHVTRRKNSERNHSREAGHRHRARGRVWSAGRP